MAIRWPWSRRQEKALDLVDNRGGGWYRVMEPFTGAWQRNQSIDVNTAATFHADFACKTLIARDIAKLRVKLVERDAGGIWSEVDNSAFSPVLRTPNKYQTRNQFWESWILSKLSRGNTYVLKEYDNRNVVTAMHVLDPRKVQPLIADDGSVFYRLAAEKLAVVSDEIIVPARFLIHDRMNCLDHWLCGIPPIFASALASTQGINIQRQSVRLFENNATPGGILTAPGMISETTSERLKADWASNYGGRNIGKVAILGDGLKYDKMSLTAVEGQLIEQLKLTAEIVCSTYHVPPYKIGVGAPPSYNNVQSLNLEYYSCALQSLIEEAEECLDAGLGIGWSVGRGTEFDTDNLLRMDSLTQANVEKELVGAGVKSPNESRGRFDLAPKAGGDSPYLQQQNYSLAALAKRDAQADPFESKTPAPAPAAPADKPADNMTADQIDESKVLFAWKLKSLLAA